MKLPLPQARSLELTPGPSSLQMLPHSALISEEIQEGIQMLAFSFMSQTWLELEKFCYATKLAVFHEDRNLIINRRYSPTPSGS